jgi:iron complex transport system substrate-binding protein
MRVVSLIASSTEMVCALGCGADLVGRSHECDYPAELVGGLPKLTAPKFAVEGASAAIDERVKEIVRNASAVYEVFPEKLEAVRPDVIITQTQCEVCAVSLRDVEAAVCQLVSSRPRIVALEPHGLADIFGDIERVAEALGVVERGHTLVSSLRARVDEIAARARAAASRPTVGCVEWIDPLMAAGNWMPTLVELAGGVNLFGEENKHSPFMDWSKLVAADPDVLVMLPCGFDIARTQSEMHILTARPEWRSLRAVKAGRVFVADGNQFFNRPGPRIVESLEILAELVHPEIFAPRFENTGWVRVAGG